MSPSTPAPDFPEPRSGFTSPVLTADEWRRHLALGLEVSGVEVDEIVLPATRQIKLRGLRFNYMDWGGADDMPTLLFLHGGGLNAHTWDLVCLALRGEYRCLALDQRGHGDTDWSGTGAYRRDDHVQDIHAFLTALRVARPVVIGMSLGGLNTIAYAAGRSDLAGAVLVDVGPDVHPPAITALLAFMTKGTEPAPFETFLTRAMAFNTRRDIRLLRTSLLHNVRPVGDDLWIWKYDARGTVTGTAEEISAANAGLWEAVPQISCPVLVVRGGESKVFRHDDAVRLTAALPRAEMATVEGAAHTVQGDNPKGLLAVLRPFLQRLLG
jgi:pimeloyl-ACP methyl ester carboxylesterase